MLSDFNTSQLPCNWANRNLNDISLNLSFKRASIYPQFEDTWRYTMLVICSFIAKKFSQSFPIWKDQTFLLFIFPPFVCSPYFLLVKVLCICWGTCQVFVITWTGQSHWVLQFPKFQQFCSFYQNHFHFCNICFGD